MSETWKLHDKVFTKYIPAEEIQQKVSETAAQLNHDFEGKKPLFIVILNGAFIFASDLIKQITIDCEVAFVRLASYQGTGSTGKIQEVYGLDRDISGRSIIIVEDIVDTGLTLNRFLQTLKVKNPAEVKIVSCFLKPDAFQMDFTIDYLCFSIPDKFIVGYGLDFNGLGRNSGHIFQIMGK